MSGKKCLYPGFLGISGVFLMFGLILQNRVRFSRMFLKQIKGLGICLANFLVICWAILGPVWYSLSLKAPLGLWGVYY